MTRFNNSSKCALSILLAVMMLFSSVLTGADALTKNAQDTAQAAVETAVDTAAKIEADTSAETAAEEAAEEAAAPEAEPVEADAAVAVTSAKADSAEVDAETVQTVAHVKKTPEKSGSSDIKRVYFHNNYKSNLSGNKTIYYFGGSHGLSDWNDRENMNLVSGTSNLYYYDIPSDATTVIFEGNGTQTVDLDVTGTSEYIFIPTGTSDGKVTCSKSLYEIEIEDDKTYLLYYKNSYGWVPCYTYMFGSGDNAAWPGEFMSKVSGQENLYAIDISEGHSSFNQITFSDGTNIDNDPSHRSQNTDFSFSTDVYSNSSKKVWVPRDTTINEEDSGTKTRRQIYSTNLSDIIGTDDLSPCNLFAKDGTVRTNPHYQKYSDFCDTTIVSINGNTNPTVASEDYYKKAAVSSGDVVTVKTTINYPYNNAYYVKGFSVNGVTYGVIDEPSSADPRRTSTSGGEYTLTYTVTDEKYIEITPIYFYIENGGTYSNLGFITFHVEKYTGNIEAQWGNTISCQVWYTEEFSREDNKYSDNGEVMTLEDQNKYQNALGGFPGQPLVYDDGDYYMQVPKALPSNYSSVENIDGSKVTVQGMTLSNYYWDDVHHILANKSDDSSFRGAKNERTGTTSENRERNSQTYDFNDFAALAKMGADDIIFTFKYRTKLFNRENVTANYLNSFSNILNVKYKDGWNGWDGLVDYHNRAVDVSGHILTKPSTNEPYTESDLVDSVSGNGDGNKTYNAAEAAEMIWIVSKGYQDIENTQGNGYYGSYATSWDFYKYVVGTGFVKINESYSLPGSSFIPPETPYETFDADGHLPTEAQDSEMYTRNKDKYLAFSDNSSDYNTATYDEFVKVYNETLGKRTMIAFEESKLLYANYDGETGVNYSAGTTNYTSYTSTGTNAHHDNPAYRCDGRWYYSTADSGDVKAHLLIEYKNSGATSYTKDTYTSSGVGETTGATLRFTTPDNDDAAKVWKDTSGVHAVDTYNSDEYFAFNAPSYSTGTNNKVYKFVGWYLLIGSNYTAINPSDIANVNGKHVRNVTNNYVARYEEVDTSNYAIIQHRVAEKSTGSGKTYTTVQVKKDGSIVKTYPKTEGTVQIDAQYLDDNSGYSINLILTYEPDAYSTYIGTKNYYNGELMYNNNYTYDQANQTLTRTFNSGSEISSIFDNENTRTVTYYTSFNLNTFTVYYSYYDRDMENRYNDTVELNNFPVQISVNVPYKSGETIREIIINGLNQKVNNGTGSMSIVKNILDKYYLWPTQIEAEDGIKKLPDYPSDPTGNTLYSERKDETDFSLHFGPFGEPISEEDLFDPDDKSMNGWVIYSGLDDDISKSKSEYEYTPADFKEGVENSVTVWAFNTPKTYTLNFYYPKSTTNDDAGTIAKFSNKVLPGNENIYCIPAGETDDNYLTREYTFYGQRLGVMIGEDDSTASTEDRDARNIPGTHIANYGIKIGYTGTEVIAKQQVSQSGVNYYFDGWYDVKTGVKLSSEYNYGYRVTSGMDIAAGYTKVESGKTYDPNSDIGVSLTANDFDFYFDTSSGENQGVNVGDGDGPNSPANSITEHIRFNTQLNVYNCNDNEAITDTAIVYVRLRVQGAGSGYTTADAKNLVNDTDFMQKLRNDIVAAYNDEEKASIMQYDPVTITTTYNETKVAVEYCYAYDSYGLTLNNKNRGMYTTNFTIDEVSTNAPFSAILAYGAIKKDGNWIFSDNFVPYIDVTKTNG